MMRTSNNIAVLGCGWLGLPLAKALLKKGYRVKGSTTSPERIDLLEREDIDPYLLKVQPKNIEGDLLSFIEEINTLIIDFPPGIRSQPPEDYVQSIKTLLGEIRRSSVNRLLFVSSISVYQEREDFPRYTEKDPPNADSSRGKALLEVEKLLQAEAGFTTCILRLGGLIGAQRHPINQLSGRTGVANPTAPVNLIHLHDCIGIILKILQHEPFKNTFNAVYPSHPDKEVYYNKKAAERGLSRVEYASGSVGKIIDSGKVEEVLGYSFSTEI